ncbi:lysylphosphatidylglycerol synthase transmembrane domain-containing protein [Chitinispirillales bacterium ANBcel5]|uniref:lysylphosphatidylglycerol synthase transmembrane domain-containing protein n=1 Tax=Cellulosispirillum alkaliphilum TaxID=3039283 RepID=UPI002A50AE49|nr:lysylphosphatidylglycerol synthase transmembrane domain-containing protein [Chitinispirillales bacterium ANBcel5]
MKNLFNIKFPRWAKLCLTITIIATVISKLGWENIVHTVLHTNLLWLFLSLAIFTVSIISGVLQWHTLLKNRGIQTPRSRACKIYFMGLFFSNFLLGGILGDAVRVAAIHSHENEGKKGLAATFLDRFAGLWVLCGFAVTGSLIVLSSGGLNDSMINLVSLTLAVMFMIFAGIMTFLTLKPLQRAVFTVTDYFGPLRKLGLRAILSEMLINARDIKLLSTIASLSTITQVLRISSYILVAHSLGLVTSSNIGYFFVLIPITGIMTTIPLPFGFRETIAGALFSLAGLQAEAAFVLGFLASIVAISASLPGGIFLIFDKSSSRSKTKKRKEKLGLKLQEPGS